MSRRPSWRERSPQLGHLRRESAEDRRNRRASDYRERYEGKPSSSYDSMPSRYEGLYDNTFRERGGGEDRIPRRESWSELDRPSRSSHNYPESRRESHGGGYRRMESSSRDRGEWDSHPPDYHRSREPSRHESRDRNHERERRESFHGSHERRESFHGSHERHESFHGSHERRESRDERPRSRERPMNHESRNDRHDDQRNPPRGSGQRSRGNHRGKRDARISSPNRVPIGSGGSGGDDKRDSGRRESFNSYKGGGGGGRGRGRGRGGGRGRGRGRGGGFNNRGGGNRRDFSWDKKDERKGDESQSMSDGSDDERSMFASGRPDSKAMFYCHVCKVQCSSLSTLQTHFGGAKHLRKLEMQGLSANLTDLVPNDPALATKVIKCNICDITCHGAELSAHTASERHAKALEKQEDIMVEDLFKIAGELPDEAIKKGKFYCELCKVSLPKQEDYDLHLTGKKHLKKERWQYLHEQASDDDEPEAKQYWCRLCNLFCTDIEALDLHYAGNQHNKVVKDVMTMVIPERTKTVIKTTGRLRMKTEREIKREPDDGTPLVLPAPKQYPLLAVASFMQSLGKDVFEE